MKKTIIFTAIIIFTCRISAQVYDIDNNSYEIISIGEQEWLSSNLRVKQYSDGTPIPEITTTSAWASATTGAWCYVNSDPETEEVYGLLYNKYALMGVHDNDESTPNKSITFSGWKIPSADEFDELIDYAGGTSNAGYVLKSVSGWNSLCDDCNGNGDNSTGFNAYPAGNRQHTTGTYANFGDNALFWSEELVFYGLNFVNSNVQIDTAFRQGVGISLRLIKDNTAGIDNATGLHFNIFPNPTSDIINIKWIENCNLSIFNTLGQIILQANNTKTIDVSSLPKGVYLIKIFDGENSSIKKFIKN